MENKPTPPKLGKREKLKSLRRLMDKQTLAISFGREKERQGERRRGERQMGEGEGREKEGRGDSRKSVTEITIDTKRY